MAASIPYTFIQCPCSDESVDDQENDELVKDDVGNEQHNFDPRAVRSNYSLFPLEYLLYCDQCQQIRCPRCVTEETLTYYCPSCLFEVPSSNLRTDGNRCNRNCYQCPICISPLQTAAVRSSPDANLLGAETTSNSSTGPFALVCQYCQWSSSEIGIEFERSSGITSQLAKINNGGAQKLTERVVKEMRKEHPDAPPLPDDQVDSDLQFANLKSFYQNQVSDIGVSLGGMSMADSLGFASPASISHIMSLYSKRGQAGKPQGPVQIMRQALTTDEGFKLTSLDDSDAIQKLHNGHWQEETASREQRSTQTSSTRFVDELRPIAQLLRTKRAKRCPGCRHFIYKPDNKVTSTRIRFRIVAQSYIPTITIRPFQTLAPPVPVTSRPGIPEEPPMKPFKTYQYILTFKNPIFEKIKITLATPNSTPGRFSSKVTLLCSQFEVDANTDMWDDALKADEGRGKKRGEDGTAQVEAGQIWERGRNWASVVMEVIPPSLNLGTLPTGKDKKPNENRLKEDEDVLEVPMFVRLEWEADAQNDMGTTPGKDKDAKEKKELAYWCVLGLGRISYD